MTFLLGLVVGVFVGAFIGFMTAVLAFAAREADGRLG